MLESALVYARFPATVRKMGRRIFAEKTFLGEEQDQIGPKKVTEIEPCTGCE